MKHELEAGNYSLKFKAIRGNLENQKVLLDNIRVKTSFTQKTDKEIPDTTTTTTTVTYFNPLFNIFIYFNVHTTVFLGGKNGQENCQSF